MKKLLTLIGIVAGLYAASELLHRFDQKNKEQVSLRAEYKFMKEVAEDYSLRHRELVSELEHCYVNHENIDPEKLDPSSPPPDLREQVRISWGYAWATDVLAKDLQSRLQD